MRWRPAWGDIVPSKSHAAGTVGNENERQLRAKVAERLVAEARSRVTAANRTLLALILLILWSWLANLSWIDLSGGKVGTQSRRIEEVKTATNRLEQRCVDLPGKPPRNVEDEKATAAQCRQGIKDLKETFGRLNSSFDLLLIKLLDVHLKFHPLLLVVLVSFAIAYASWTRFKILLHLSEAVRIYREELGWTGRHSGTLLPATPFWMWPLSSSSGGSLSREDCADYLGLTGADWWRPLLTNIAILALLLVTIHIFYVQSSLSGDVLGYDPAYIDDNWKNSSFSAEEKTELKKLHSPLSFTGSKPLDIAVLLALLSPALFLLALGPSIANVAGLRQRARREAGYELPRFSRRNLFLVGGTLVAIAAVVPGGSWNLSAWLKPVLGRSPRFRKKARLVATPLRPGLYVRTHPIPAPPENAPSPARSGAAVGGTAVRPPLRAPNFRLYRVRPDRTVGGVRQSINPEHYRRVARFPGRMDPSRLSPPSRYEIVELTALHLARVGQPERAMAQLWSAILPEGRPPSPDHDLRLYDLLAGLAVRHGRLEDLQRLVRLARQQLNLAADRLERVSGSRLSNGEQGLQKRLERWLEPEGPWQRRWRSSPRRWRGVDIPLPRSNPV